MRKELIKTRKMGMLLCFWPRERLCLMLVAAGVVRLLFTRQLTEAICRFWSIWWLGARTCMLKTGKC